jgi:hypothetical protein
VALLWELPTPNNLLDVELVQELPHPICNYESQKYQVLEFESVDVTILSERVLILSMTSCVHHKT